MVCQVLQRIHYMLSIRLFTDGQLVAPQICHSNATKNTGVHVSFQIAQRASLPGPLSSHTVQLHLNLKEFLHLWASSDPPKQTLHPLLLSGASASQSLCFLWVNTQKQSFWIIWQFYF